MQVSNRTILTFLPLTPIRAEEELSILADEEPSETRRQNAANIKLLLRNDDIIQFAPRSKDRLLSRKERLDKDMFMSTGRSIIVNAVESLFEMLPRENHTKQPWSVYFEEKAEDFIKEAEIVLLTVPADDQSSDDGSEQRISILKTPPFSHIDTEGLKKKEPWVKFVMNLMKAYEIE